MLPIVPMMLAGTMLLIKPSRILLLDAASSTPRLWFVAIQECRIAAIGTLLRTIQGEFPHHIELAIGLNDLVFGLSAIPMFLLAKSGRLSNDALVIWHMAGIMIIVIPAGISIELGMPGYWGTLVPHATSAPMFDYPMILAPALVVPSFLMLSMMGIAGLVWKRQ